MANTSKASIQSDVVNLSVIWVREADNLSPDRHWNTKEHYHAFYELHAALEGHVDMNVDEKLLRLEKGSYLLIPPKYRHCFGTMSADYREFVAGFYMDFSNVGPDGKLIQGALKRLDAAEVLACSTGMQGYVADCLRYARNVSGYSVGIAINLCLILLEIASQVSPESVAAEMLDEEKLLDEIKIFIASNLSNGINTEKVASHMHVSARHLNRLLKTKLHKSVSDLIMDERMGCIRRLLTTTDMTLEHIAELAGFSNAYNMSRAFKKQEGMSPGEYRRSLRKK